jgi:hypothetical protein
MRQVLVGLVAGAFVGALWAQFFAAWLGSGFGGASLARLIGSPYTLAGAIIGLLSGLTALIVRPRWAVWVVTIALGVAGFYLLSLWTGNYVARWLAGILSGLIIGAFVVFLGAARRPAAGDAPQS